jgi:site-specific DNA-cytosine methylase
MKPTHASFFSGAGGLDLGLDKAGWTTVSFSEVNTYCNALLAQRWPGVPNLGDITKITEVPQETAKATLWSGGFPCQDLSIAGKRAGFGHESGFDTRSGLAFAFLDLVEYYRPPALVLENVPGLLSSHAGRDFGLLLDTLGKLGYGWAYRILDARYFGVPQRRRRVFIVGLDTKRGFTADSAASILSVGSRCGRHPKTGGAKGKDATTRFADGIGGAGIAPQAVSSKWYRGSSGPAGDEHHNMVLAPTLEGGANRTGGIRPPGSTVDTAESLVVEAFDYLNTGSAFGEGETGSLPTRPGWSIVSPTPDPGGDGETDGVAGRLDHRQGLEAWTKVSRPHGPGGDGERWTESDLSPTINSFENTAVRAITVVQTPQGEDELLPIGLDSQRYLACGNGVVAPVAQWIGERLLSELTGRNSK